MNSNSDTEATAQLRVAGPDIVDGSGETVHLRGVGLGGWMNMENFVTGHPFTEEAVRRAISQAIGTELSEAFFDGFLTHFFGEEDAVFVKSLGMNSIRVPFNHRHLIPDDTTDIREEGFRHLDRIIDICSRLGIYTILDLHTYPGGQNQAWHSDNPTHHALFWDYELFQARVVDLWREIAARYKNNPWVAGFNPMNEPGDPSDNLIGPFYERVVEAIRESDENHIVFLDGNRFSKDFHMFDDPWPNVVYSIHDYHLPGYPDGGPYPGESRGRFFDRSVVESDFLDRIQYMRETDTPIWVGEFGPVYREDPEQDEMRYQLLRDQLALYREHEANWSIWTYKDIGLQGLVSLDADSEWMRRVAPIVAKKERLGTDTWGTTDREIRHLTEPIQNLIAAEYPSWDPFPFGARWMVNRLIRHILFAEPMTAEFAERFKDVDEETIEAVMSSFDIAACHQRTELVSILREELAD